MSGDSGREEIGVFVKTSLGTRLALSVPPATTAALLIRKVERAHFDCLPCFGEIKVQGFMVKHKSCFYQISPSAPLVCALGNSKGPCFLHARAVQVNTRSITPCTTLEREVALEDGFHCQPCDVGGVECSVMSILEKNLEQKCQVVEVEGNNSEPVVEGCVTVPKGNRLEAGHSGDDHCINLENSTSTTPSSGKSPYEEKCGVTGVEEDDCASENSSTTRSVADIIRRHCPDTDTIVESPYLPERANNRSFSKLCIASPVPPELTPRSSGSGLFMLKDAGFGRMSMEGKRPDVGQRLLMASSKLGISPSNPSPVVSMYRSKGRKHFGTDVQIKNPIFEMSENSG